MKIYKYILDHDKINAEQVLMLPFTRQLINAEYFNHKICLWYVVNDSEAAMMESVCFVVKYTGDEVNAAIEKHIATVIDNNKCIVMHVFTKES